MIRQLLISLFLISCTAVSFAATAKPITLIASQATLTGGVTLATSISGYSGRGFATNIAANDAQVQWTIPHATAGIYQATIRFSSPSGPKGYVLVVNGHSLSGMFPSTDSTWHNTVAGKIELKSGANTVAIQRGWGYFDIDSVTFSPSAPYPIPIKPKALLTDPKATSQARALMRYLVSHYGTSTLSGQYDQGDSDYVTQNTGVTPAIIGGDLSDYSPSRIAHGADPKNESEKMIASAKAGQIVTLSWHWNAPTDLLNTTDQPWWKGFYTTGSTFDIQYALAHPQSPEYKLLLSNIDTIAVQLRKFQAAGVPVLWRPLHEAEGGWFWWGAKGPEPFKQLWRLLYHRLTVTDNIHNLIWVDCSGTNTAWYPGDKYVDIVGIDQYPDDVADPLGQVWQTLQKEYGGRKLIALTEFGGVPDIQKMFRYGVRWSYFVSWSGNLSARKMTLPALKSIYQGAHVINKQNLPKRLSAH